MELCMHIMPLDVTQPLYFTNFLSSINTNMAVMRTSAVGERPAPLKVGSWNLVR